MKAPRIVIFTRSCTMKSAVCAWNTFVALCGCSFCCTRVQIFPKTGDYVVSMFPEFRDMYCFKDLRHKSYHTSPLPNCFSSCLSNKYSQLLTHQTNTRTEKSPTRIADSGVHHCSILVAAMGRICDLSFAVILVFCLTKGTSSNQGKPYHWLLVFIIISTRHRGEI